MARAPFYKALNKKPTTTLTDQANNQETSIGKRPTKPNANL